MSLVKVYTKDLHTYVNAAIPEKVGEVALLAEDLSNVVEVGTAIANADAYENFLGGLLLQYNNIKFENRAYKSQTLDIIRDNFEYGQITAVVRTDLRDADINQSWQLTNGASYDDNQYISNTVTTKIYKQDGSFEVRASIATEQVKNAFRGANELAEFVSMIFTSIENSLELQRQSLLNGTVCNAIAEVINANKSTQYIKLLTMYNTLMGTSLTAAQAKINADFIKWANAKMNWYRMQMKNYSTLFNVSGIKTFTPVELQHFVLTAEWASNTDTFLSSSTFHDEFVKLPYHEIVPYWQGQGTSLGQTDSINVGTTASGASNITASNVIGIVFDHYALGMRENKPTVTTKYNAAAEFTNYWFKEKVSYFNNLDYNMLVFTLE